MRSFAADGRSTDTATLADLARWTGGDMRICQRALHTPSTSVKDLFAELRHQYLITFEPGPRPGWHPLEIRTRKKRPGRSCAEWLQHHPGV